MTLVDTSVWVDYLNGFQSQEAQWLYKAIREDRPLVIPGLVLAEILCGLKGEDDSERIQTIILAGFEEAPPLVLDDYVDAARLFRKCRSRGFTLRSLVDCLIAGICIRYGYSLLSKDRDFLSIAAVVDLNLLRVTG